MSLLDQASLVLVPSAIKTGEVLVQKPLPNKFADETGNYDGNDPQTNANLTFTRASNATRVNADGLIERVRTNYLLQSNSFDTTWTASNASVTSSQADKDGGNTAWLLNTSAANGAIYQGISVASGTLTTYSIYAKAGSLNWFRFRLGSSPKVSRYFDLQNGVIGSGGTAPLSAEITSVGGGWYRCSITTNIAIDYAYIYTALDDNDLSATSGNIVIQNAQIEVSDFGPTDYIPTTTSARSTFAGITVDGTSVPNVPRLDYSGGATCPSLLLEGQRTNAFLWSEQLNNAGWIKAASGTAAAPVVTANYAISPDGYQNADRVQFDAVGTTSADRSSLHQNFAFTSGQVYTISAYAKSATGSNQVLQFRIAGAQVGGELTATSEWQRFSVTYTATATTTDNFGVQLRGDNTSNESDLLLFGLQLEQASYATSYIPTQGSAVTRLADSATLATIPSSTATSFTIFADWEYLNAANGVFIFKNTSNANSYILYYYNGKWDVFNGSAFITNFNVTAQRGKIAIVHTPSTVKVFINGADNTKAGASPSASLAQRIAFSPTTIQDAALNSLLYIPSALTDAQAIELTTL